MVDFSFKKNSARRIGTVELSETAFRLANWMRRRNGVPPGINPCIYGQVFSGPLPALHLRVGAERQCCLRLANCYVMCIGICCPPCAMYMYVSNVTSHCLQQQIKTWWNCPVRAFRLAYWMRCRNGVPAPTEVVERRSGSFRLKLSTDNLWHDFSTMPYLSFIY